MPPKNQKGRAFLGTEKLDLEMKKHFKKKESSQKVFLLEKNLSRTTYRDIFNPEKGATKETLQLLLDYLFDEHGYTFDELAETYYTFRKVVPFTDFTEKKEENKTIQLPISKYLSGIYLSLFLTFIVSTFYYFFSTNEKSEIPKRIQIPSQEKPGVVIVPFVSTSGEIDSNYILEKALRLRLRRETNIGDNIYIIPNDTINKFNAYNVAKALNANLILFGHLEKNDLNSTLAISWIYAKADYDSPFYKGFNKRIPLKNSSDFLSGKNSDFECFINKHIGALYEISFQQERAMGFYNEAYKHCPNDRRLLSVMAVNNVKLGLYKEGLKIFEQRLKSNPGNIFDIYRVFKILEHLKSNPEGELNLYRTVIVGSIPCNYSFPDSLTYLKPKTIIQEYQKLIKSHPNNSRYLYLLGRYCHIIRNDLSKAKKYYHQYLNKVPNSDDTHSELSILYRKLGDVRKAIFHKKQALKLELKKIDLHSLGHFYIELEKLDSALYFYRKAEQEGAFGQINIDISKTYARLNRHLLADSSFNETIRKFPNLAWAKYEYSEFLLELGKVEKADSIVQTIVQEHPHSEYAYRGLYILASRKKNFESAFEQLKKVLQVNYSDDNLYRAGMFCFEHLEDKSIGSKYLSEYVERVKCLEEQKKDSNKSEEYLNALNLIRSI